MGSDVAVREYPGGDFDQTFLAAHTGPRWLAGPITDVSLLATAQRQWLGAGRTSTRPAYAWKSTAC